MKLLNDEEKIIELTSNKLLLTNKRMIKYGDKYASIPHSHISMIKLDFNHNPNLISNVILFTIIAFVLYVAFPIIAFLPFILPVYYLFQYFNSRHYSIKICSTGGGIIESKISGSQKKTVLDFIYRVEEIIQ
ncbi:hypothetical protein [Dokdonia sp.]|uniref:hypothetical protein n=1 Tax=Dokdonia sp. TaxID=2024995 RepID=UPI003264AFC8